MKSFITSILLTLTLVQGPALLSGQDFTTIKGQVVTFGEYPLNKVEIITAKSMSQTFTDSTGYFTIRCLESEKISFKAQGFDEYSAKVKKLDDSDINLVYSNRENSFALATKNGHISEAILKEAIETKPLKGDKDYSTYTNIYDIIDDEIFTVNVNGTSITTTKPSSLTGSQEVLLVIDETIVSDISFVSPMNVKSIRYLEGTQAAKYGSRGANGIIEITTKKR